MPIYIYRILNTGIEFEALNSWEEIQLDYDYDLLYDT